MKTDSLSIITAQKVKSLRLVLLLSVLVMLFTLILLSKLESFFERLHQVKFYKISFMASEYSLEELEKKFREIGLKFRKYKEAKDHNEITVYYKFSDKQKEFEQLNDYLMQNKSISGFEM